MIRIILPVALFLSACATMPSVTETSVKVTAAIDRAEATYLRVKPFADLAAALRPAWAAQIHESEARIEQGIATARAALTVAEQVAALAQAASAMTDLATATAPATPLPRPAAP